MFWLEFIVVLLAVFIGARLKGIGLGIMGGLGLAVLTFGFHVQPNAPPIEVLLIVTAVVTAASTLENAGGLKCLVVVAEKLIRKHPHQITFIGPFITYLFTFLSGTTHISYSILPVIAEVSRETGVRPERPLSACVTAAQQAITASPISAATAILVALLSPYNIELFDILKICVPATLAATLIASLVSSRMGKDLDQDTEYLERMKILEQEEKKEDNKNTSGESIPKTAKLSVFLFLLGIFAIVFFGSFKTFRPRWDIDGEIIVMNMTVIIQIIMLVVSAVIVLACNLNTPDIVKGNVFRAGMQAVIAIFGISWLGNTFFRENMDYIIYLIKGQIESNPLTFSLYLFLLSIFLVSQAATVRALFPLGISLGIPPMELVAMFPAVNGLFFLPNHPVILAAINFDRTGTTTIGKYILNHSFMLPGLAATISAVIIGYALSTFIF